MAHFFSKVQFSPLFQPIFTPKTPPHIVLKKPFTGKPAQVPWVLCIHQSTSQKKAPAPRNQYGGLNHIL